MKIKNEKGLSGIDIIISVALFTIFMTLIGTLIVNINSNTLKQQKNSEALTYAVQEIENIKADQYKTDYNDKGISEVFTYKNEDIYSASGDFTGYHKTIYIQDYQNEYLAKNTSKSQTDPETPEENKIKKLTVKISYKFKGKDQNVELSTYVQKK